MKLIIDRKNFDFEQTLKSKIGNMGHEWLVNSNYDIVSQDVRIEQFDEIDFNQIKLVYGSLKPHQIPLDIPVLNEVHRYLCTRLKSIPNGWRYQTVHFSGSMLYQKDDRYAAKWNFPGPRVKMTLRMNSWLVISLTNCDQGVCRVEEARPFTSGAGPEAVIEV